MTSDKLTSLKEKLLAGGKGAAPVAISKESLGTVKAVPLKVEISEEERAARAEQFAETALTVDGIVEEFGGLGLAGLAQAGKF